MSDKPENPGVEFAGLNPQEQAVIDAAAAAQPQQPAQPPAVDLTDLPSDEDYEDLADLGQEEEKRDDVESVIGALLEDDTKPVYKKGSEANIIHETKNPDRIWHTWFKSMLDPGTQLPSGLPFIGGIGYDELLDKSDRENVKETFLHELGIVNRMEDNERVDAIFETLEDYAKFVRGAEKAEYAQLNKKAFDKVCRTRASLATGYDQRGCICVRAIDSTMR